MEYFRNTLIAMTDACLHPLATAQLRGPVRRSIARNFRARSDLYRSAQLRLRRTQKGLITGVGWSFELDIPGFTHTVEKTVRALFYYKSHSPLPPTHTVRVYPDNSFWQDKAILKLINSLPPPEHFGDTVFCCRCQRDSADPSHSVWLLAYYGQLALFAWTDEA